MKKPTYLFLAIFCLIFQNGCDVTDQLEDPTKLARVELPLLLPTAISQTAYNQQAMPARAAGTYMQYWTDFDARSIFSIYAATPFFFNDLWDEGLYGGSIKDCQLIIAQAREEGNPHFEGIAKILLANEIWHTTIMFGDIPFSEAGKGLESLNPAFDSQRDVINAVFQMLEEAILLLENETTLAGPGNSDLIFGGDAQAWRRTARALQARCHIQMSKRDLLAAEKALQALEAGAVSSLAEQPTFPWGSSFNEAQPLAKFGRERANSMIIDKRFAEKFLENDPRRNIYAYQDSNSWTDNWYYYRQQEPLHWSAPDAAIPLISYVEVAFIKAEALWRIQASVAEIQTALNEGIIASMEQVGLTAAAYEPYVEALPRLADLSREAQLEHILNESYKAYYGYAAQITWANYRRTGYPKLTPFDRGSSVFNPEGAIPKRHLYPESETLQNPDNVEAAQEAQQGALMDVPLWIFK